MSNPFKYLLFRHFVKKCDDKRDSLIDDPKGVKEYRDIRYSNAKGKYGLLDVYRPENAEGKLPLIVVVHGGGWIYGTKDTYRLYGMDLATRGFSVLVYSYRLSPQAKFPSHLIALDEALSFAKEKQDEYGFDVNNVFLAGDSAGAHMAFHYSVINSNPDYAALFSVKNPLKIRGTGLACGTYKPLVFTGDKSLDYTRECLLPKHFDETDPRLDPLSHVTSKLPPAYVFTSEKDFLLEEGIKMDEFLTAHGIKHGFKIYRSEEGDKLQHVFHCTVNEKHAIEANDDQTAFFKSLMA